MYPTLTVTVNITPFQKLHLVAGSTRKVLGEMHLYLTSPVSSGTLPFIHTPYLRGILSFILFFHPEFLQSLFSSWRLGSHTYVRGLARLPCRKLFKFCLCCWEKYVPDHCIWNETGALFFGIYRKITAFTVLYWVSTVQWKGKKMSWPCIDFHGVYGQEIQCIIKAKDPFHLSSMQERGMETSNKCS